MKIDVELYRINKPGFIQFYLDKKDHHDIGYITSMMACVTHVPCYVVYYYIGEEFGFSEEILNGMESLKRFYEYE